MDRNSELAPAQTSVVEHDSASSRFVIKVGEDECVLQYNMLDVSSVDFYRTFVPFSLRGQNHAEALLDSGLDWAEHNNFNILSSCWYAAKRLALRDNA